ncbi:MAG: rod shape-determining protein RodA [Longimicrobiaceae bacterium]
MPRFRLTSLGDPVLFALVVLLAFFGVAMVYSAGIMDVPSAYVAGAWRLQLLWFALALLAIPLVLRVPVSMLETVAPPLYAVALVLLALTLVIGTGVGTAEGVPRWIVLGPIRIHTAEFAKIPVILMLARVLGEWREPPTTLWALWKPIAVVLVPMGLVMLQPDLGTAIVFSFILIATLFWAGTPLRMMFFLVSPALALFLAFNTWVWGAWITIVAAGLFLARLRVAEGASVFVANVAAGAIALPFWNSLAQYQKNRILVFLDPSIDPRGAGYNLIQARVAIGSGGWSGKGFLEGTQKRLAFIPEQHTDFIFAIVGEEWGFLGVTVVILVFALVFWRLVRIASRTADPFGSLVPFGLFASWFIHVFVNTGMNIGIMPITGIPLPFISYGGSFLLVNLLAMAIVQRIAAENPSPG